ncbi:hypothetical protein GWK47_001988 [Chionoecetes opilio]|uniref:Uncharacterized protein n=1 Tax=Chionoecetes opilio TaxID=41210 RepID=A0A8J4XTW9_CHIOP|nr:hypothetical protein GWK47_001988 [Chionoecetes opilio]
MMIHLADAVRDGFQKKILRTVNTDIVALAVAATTKLKIQELWVAFGTGQHFRYIPAHEIAAFLGPDKSQALPMVHACTGCDTVSSFNTRGKKTAWDTWKVFNELTPALVHLSTGTADISDDVVAVLERFTILLYDRTSNLINIDEARQALFTKKGRAMEAILLPESPGTTNQEGCVHGFGPLLGKHAQGCFWICPHLGIGDGSIPTTGNPCGPCFLKPALHQGS